MKSHSSLLVPALALLLVVAPGAARAEEKPREIEDGALDSILLRAEKLPTNLPIVVKHFSTEGVKLGTGQEGGKETRVEAAKAMVTLGPDLLATSLITRLREGARFQQIVEPGATELPAEYLVLEGKFLKIEPGSRAKRYWGGFGAGKSGVQVTGLLKDSAGKVLAEFTHMKHSGMGIGGGDYLKFLSDDTKDIGYDIGNFLDRWAAGQDLREDN